MIGKACSNSGSANDVMGDDELGSELSGMSVEIPIEIEDYTMSGSYLREYDRDYKTGVMYELRGRGLVHFKSP